MVDTLGTGLLTWVSKNIDFPAVVLIIILVLGLWVLWKTQQDVNNDFNFEDMLRDDCGKPSAYRLAIFVCLAVSTWVLMYSTIAAHGNLDTWMFAWYIAVWSGAKVAEKGIEAYAARGTGQSNNLGYQSRGPYNSSNNSHLEDDSSYQERNSQSGNNQTLNPSTRAGLSATPHTDKSPLDEDNPGGGLRDTIPQDMLITRSVGRN